MNVKKRNKILCIVFGILNHVFSWIGPLAYVAIQYGTYIKGANKMVLVFIFALILGIWFLLKELNEIAETGYAMNKEIARAVKFLIPIVLFLVLTIVLDKNLANMVDVIKVFCGGMIAGRVFYLAHYRLSKKYIRDTGINKLVNRE